MRTTSFSHLVFSLAGAAALTIATVRAQTPAERFTQSPNEPIVTGAPYSGEGTTTVTMKMFDGTQIDRRVTARLYRDSTGRVRREQTVLGLETLDPTNDVRAIVTIIDPVANAIYTLIPGSKTANRLALDQIMKQAVPMAGGPKPREEPLGTRDLDGISVVGYRMVTVIPTGQVGNDRPIEITDERWESRELKVLVQSRHHDPRTGDVEYRLTKISRTEPPADLFKVPAGYKIVDIPPKGPAD